ncbi:DUF6480 family protein [Streptomyces sp. NPDC059753]|uniref:DUF6480 family protein n=1 Tax=Streptomyces sp. NPDC059753 TaxID=3346933 RepID=UPI00366302B9
MTDPLVPPEETPPAEGSIAETHEERADGGLWDHPLIWVWRMVASAAIFAALFIVRLIDL